MEAVIFMGVQSAGKSSYFRERFYCTHIRISMDLMKTRHREGRFFDLCLESGDRLLGLSTAEKNELLFRAGINFNELPNWQKRGVGLYWEEYDKPALNPVTGQNVTARRRRIARQYDLPMKDDYSPFVEVFLAE